MYYYFKIYKLLYRIGRNGLCTIYYYDKPVNNIGDSVHPTLTRLLILRKRMVRVIENRLSLKTREWFDKKLY